MIGLDCLWRSDYVDEELLRVSILEKRYLLTRDRALFLKTPAGTGYYVQSVHPKEQLKEVVIQFNLGEKIRDNDLLLSRCLECNTRIHVLNEESIPNSVPENVKLRHHEFFTCLSCHRIYWKGSHFDRMKNWLEEVATHDSISEINL